MASVPTEEEVLLFLKTLVISCSSPGSLWKITEIWYCAAQMLPRSCCQTSELPCPHGRGCCRGLSLLCSDFRTAVPSPFLFLSTPKNQIVAQSLQKVSSSAARMNLLLNLGLYALLGPRRLKVHLWIPSDSEGFSLFLICRLRAAFWLVCSHCIIHPHCKIVSNMD